MNPTNPETNHANHETNARRTEPRVPCYQRPLHGAYVPAVHTTPAHLAAVFAAERERLAAARPRRTRKPRTAPSGKMQLVA